MAREDETDPGSEPAEGQVDQESPDDGADAATVFDPIEEDDITVPDQGGVTSFNLGGSQHRISRPGHADLPHVQSATSIPAIQMPDGPDADLSTSPNQRAITSFDLGQSDHALKLPPATPTPWTEDVEPIAIRLEKAGVTGATGEHLVPFDGDADEPEEPELVKPIFLDQTDPDERSERSISRRRFMARVGAVVVATGVGMHAWGRRPIPVETLGYKPSGLDEVHFRTLYSAFRALLGEDEAASRASSQADLRHARLGPVARQALEADLTLLEFGPRGLFDGRRFSRLGPDKADRVLQGWRTSRIAARRRIHADMTRLARFCWATHPASLAGGGS